MLSKSRCIIIISSFAFRNCAHPKSFTRENASPMSPEMKSRIEFRPNLIEMTFVFNVSSASPRRSITRSIFPNVIFFFCCLTRETQKKNKFFFSFTKSLQKRIRSHATKDRNTHLRANLLVRVRERNCAEEKCKFLSCSFFFSLLFKRHVARVWLRIHLIGKTKRRKILRETTTKK